MVALTDSIIDITGEVVSGSDIHTAFVRSPAQRPSYTGQGLVSTRPVDISDAGELSLDLEPGPAVLVVIGDRFRDTWTLHVEEGQTTIRDAVAAVPGVLTQHEVSVLRTLLDGAEEAAVTAGNAAGQATTAAQQTGQDRSHVDQVRALLDETYDESQAGMALPPRLMESALKATYGTKAEVAEKAESSVVDSLAANKLDKTEAASTYTTESQVESITGTVVGPLVPPLVVDALAADDTPAQAAAAAVSDAVVGLDLIERPSTAPRPGQLLMSTSAGMTWSWGDRYPAVYDNSY